MGHHAVFGDGYSLPQLGKRQNCAFEAQKFLAEAVELLSNKDKIKSLAKYHDFVLALDTGKLLVSENKPVLDEEGEEIMQGYFGETLTVKRLDDIKRVMHGQDVTESLSHFFAIAQIHAHAGKVMEEINKHANKALQESRATNEKMFEAAWCDRDAGIYFAP